MMNIIQKSRSRLSCFPSLGGRSSTSHIKEVPSNQVLLGVPMYTRVWVVDSSGKVVRNPSATMPYIENFIKENNFTQHGLRKKSNTLFPTLNGPYTDKIWIEDSRSVANRLKLVQDYNLQVQPVGSFTG